MQVTLNRARRHVGLNAVAEQHEAHGIALAKQQVGESRRQATAVVELAHGASRLEIHGAADIEKQIDFCVGLFFVALYIQTIRARERLPVDIAQRVARHILTVFRELDREAVIWAAVQSGDIPLDDQSGHEVETTEPGKNLRLEIG